MSSELEIVGLDGDANGRSCTAHDVCGEHVAVGDALHLVHCIVTCNDVDEVAIKCVKIIDGVDTCTVACVPRILMQLPKAQAHINKFVQVSELCSQSKSACKCTKSEANYGMAAMQLLLEDEGRNE